MGEVIRYWLDTKGRPVELKLDYVLAEHNGERYLAGVLVDDVLPPMPAFGKTAADLLDDMEAVLARHLKHMKAQKTPSTSPARKRLAKYVRRS